MQELNDDTRRLPPVLTVLVPLQTLEQVGDVAAERPHHGPNASQLAVPLGPTDVQRRPAVRTHHGLKASPLGRQRLVPHTHMRGLGGAGMRHTASVSISWGCATGA